MASLYDEDEDDFSEGVEEQEDLSEFSEKTIKAAHTRTAALNEGWSISDIATLLDYVPQLVTAIEEGVFDGPEIKALITACMNRRAMVLGTAPLLKDAKRGTGRAGRGGRKPTQNLGPVNSEKGLSRYTGPVLGENGVVLHPLPSYQGGSRSNFEAGGKRYSKSDMVGKVVRLPAKFDPWYLGGQLARIRDVRLKGIEVELVENPEFIHPNSTELRKEKFRVGYMFDLTAIDIEHIFA